MDGTFPKKLTLTDLSDGIIYSIIEEMQNIHDVQQVFVVLF